jgi:hypothetical protein
MLTGYEHLRRTVLATSTRFPHLSASPSETRAPGDGSRDVEMLTHHDFDHPKRVTEI